MKNYGNNKREMRRSKAKQRSSITRVDSTKSISSLNSKRVTPKKRASITMTTPSSSAAAAVLNNHDTHHHHNNDSRVLFPGFYVSMMWTMFSLGYLLYHLNDVSTQTSLQAFHHLRQQFTMEPLFEDAGNDDSVRTRRLVVDIGDELKSSHNHNPEVKKKKSLPVLKHDDFPDNNIIVNSNNNENKNKNETGAAVVQHHRNRQRVVILAGPHKAASTTLQTFLYAVAGRTTWIYPRNNPGTGQKEQHPAFWRWTWPVGITPEYGMRPETSLSGGGITHMPPAKFHAPLAALATGKAYETFLPRYREKSGNKTEQEAYLGSVTSYYRKLFAVPWRGGNNLVLGSEEFTAMVMALAGDFPRKHPPLDTGWAPVATDGVGEARHVDPHSSAMIDRLLSVLPWNATTSGRGGGSEQQQQQQQLELSDIEVHINYRTPRIEHCVSVWHQIHNGTTFREFLATNAKELYVVNSLALALQFVRKGLKTTIVDMSGANAYGKEVDAVLAHNRAVDEAVKTAGDEPRQEEQPPQTMTQRRKLRGNGDDSSGNKDDGTSAIITKETVIGGQEGIIACDILRIGSREETEGLGPGRGGPGNFRGYCDAQSRLHLRGSETMPAFKTVDSNRKEDPHPRDVSTEEFLRMDDLLREYDCGVWRQLAPYKEKGLLRVLYPSGDLFQNCGDDTRSEDMGFSFAAILREFRRIALSKKVDNIIHQ